MSAAATYTLAQDVADRINAEFTEFTAKRVWYLVKDRVKLTGGTPSVRVAAGPQDRSVADRVQNRVDHQVQIEFLQEVDPESLTECDAAADLFNQIIAKLDRFRPPSVPRASWLGSEVVQPVDYDYLRTKRAFGAVLAVTFREIDGVSS